MEIVRGTPSLPKEGGATRWGAPPDPLTVQMHSDQPLCPARVRRGARATPAGVGILLFLNNIVARMGLYPFFLIEEERVSRDTAKTLKSL